MKDFNLKLDVTEIGFLQVSLEEILNRQLNSMASYNFVLKNKAVIHEF